LSQLVPVSDNAESTTNFRRNADPNVTARLRSRRGRSGLAAAVFSNRIRKKTLTIRRGSPLSGISTAKTCPDAAHSVRITTPPLMLASAPRAGDSSAPGTSVRLWTSSRTSRIPRISA
jgi:hypothetical protein